VAGLATHEVEDDRPLLCVFYEKEIHDSFDWEGSPCFLLPLARDASPPPRLESPPRRPSALTSTSRHYYKKKICEAFWNGPQRRATILTASVNAWINCGGYFILTEAVKKTAS
jgi:hypothetical protein